MSAFGPVTPVLRIFDATKAREFYLEFLGCKLEFEHRFGENFPLYIGLSLSNCRLHLTEHHGDCCPGARIRIETDAIDEFAALLRAKDYRYAKVGEPESTPWGSRELSVSDPFGNRITFVQLNA